jgi:hypothetical protein
MHRIVQRRLQHHRAEIDQPGARGQRRHDDQRRRKYALGAGMPFREENPVEAAALGLLALFEQLLGEVGDGLARGQRLIVRSAVSVGHVSNLHDCLLMTASCERIRSYQIPGTHR